MPAFPALTHVAITVSELERSTSWYTTLLGSEPVLDEDEEQGGFHHTVFALADGQLLGLHTHPTTPPEGTFDERRPGLDHLSFQCRDIADIERWRRHLDQLGIAHGELVRAHYGSGLSFRDPDNIALEFFAPPE